MIKKRILIHSLVFSPDGVSTAYLFNDIALALKNEGFDVIVLSTTPHFNVVQEQLSEQPIKWGIWGLYKKKLFFYADNLCGETVSQYLKNSF